MNGCIKFGYTLKKLLALVKLEKQKNMLKAQYGRLDIYLCYKLFELSLK